MDITQVTPPQWFTSGIGLVVIIIIWKAVGAAIDEVIHRNFQKRRRIGQRSSDDARGETPWEGWTDRLINALNLNAEVNKEVASSLAMMVARQDAILEAFKLTQMEQRETTKKVDKVLSILDASLRSA